MRSTSVLCDKTIEQSFSNAFKACPKLSTYKMPFETTDSTCFENTGNYQLLERASSN